MGVSGCGKTTIGKMLANEFNLPFFDADDFHPAINVEKMSKGIPLNDSDRRPWLLELAEHIKNWNSKKGAVLACSALKENYRKLLFSASDKDHITLIYLHGKKDLIAERLKERSGHYMPPKLLDSQFSDLEEPDNSIQVSINQSPKEILSNILKHLKYSL